MRRERETIYNNNLGAEAPHQVRTKKSLGQHFLSDPNILDKIVRAGEVEEGELILEIGPGEGPLTEALLRTGARVIAVEKDDRLIPLLEERFATEIGAGKFSLIHGDILEVRAELEDKFTHENYKVIANIPYYITGNILRFIFSLENLPRTIVLLVQDEVAKRIVSEKESLLSLSIKAFGTPHYRGKVKAGSFSPPPKVDSAILAIENITREYFHDLDEKIFFHIIKKSFSQKRKTLLNTLFTDNKEVGAKTLESLGLSASARPEELQVEDWKQLIHSIYRDDKNK